MLGANKQQQSNVAVELAHEVQSRCHGSELPRLAACERSGWLEEEASRQVFLMLPDTRPALPWLATLIRPDEATWAHHVHLVCLVNAVADANSKTNRKQSV